MGHAPMSGQPILRCPLATLGAAAQDEGHRRKKAPPRTAKLSFPSGRRDLNPRPPEPHAQQELRLIPQVVESTRCSGHRCRGSKGPSGPFVVRNSQHSSHLGQAATLSDPTALSWALADRAQLDMGSCGLPPDSQDQAERRVMHSANGQLFGHLSHARHSPMQWKNREREDDTLLHVLVRQTVLNQSGIP